MAMQNIIDAGFNLADALKKCAESRQILAERLMRIADGNHRCSTTGQLAAWMQTEALAGLEQLRVEYPDLPMFEEADKC